MRIAIIGAGGVGGLLGALLSRSGEQVTVVARGEAFAAIQSRGLRVDSPLYGSFGAPVTAAATAGEVGPVDAVLVAVKAWQVPEVAPGLRPLVEAGAVVVPLQNGVESVERLADALGGANVAGGLVHVLAWLEAPGTVRQLGMRPRVTLGERGARAGAPSDRLAALSAALVKAGVDAPVVPDVTRAAWEKYLVIEPWGAVSAAARAPLGVVRSVPESRALLLAAITELWQVGRARGVALAADAPQATLAFDDDVTPEATASMQRDIGAGRPSELDDQTGAAIRLARTVNVPVPVHEALLAVLAPQEAAARGRIGRFTRT